MFVVEYNPELIDSVEPDIDIPNHLASLGYDQGLRRTCSPVILRLDSRIPFQGCARRSEHLACGRDRAVERNL
jgi:hypothetical protein